MTGSEFEVLYKRVETPIPPENWKDELYDDFVKFDRRFRGLNAVRDSAPSNLHITDVAKAWKLLVSQDWLHKAILEYKGEDDEDGMNRILPHSDYAQALSLLFWWCVKAGLGEVNEEGHLLNDSWKL